MHCPGCGVRIESDEISYCTRCGQMLERVRAAMSDEVMIARGTKVSRGSLNLGVGLMYIGMWPALLAVIGSPSALPIAFLMLTAVLVGVIFGSGTVLRSFQTEDLHPDIERARRKEVAFGATLMYLGTLLSALVVALAVPDWWIRIGLVAAITTTFAALLASSKTLYNAYRELGTSDHVALPPSTQNRGLITADLEQPAARLQFEDRPDMKTIEPGSVTEGTTRLLP